MRESLRELYRYRELLYMFVYRDVSVKYKQSVMGLLWAVLMPMLVVLAGLTVRYGYAVVAQRPLDAADVVSVSVRAVPWAFLVSSLRFACNSLIANSSLVTKVYFPKEVFPLAAVVSQFVDFAVAAAVLAVLLPLLGVGAHAAMLWAPLLVLVIIALATGLALLVSAASLFFRDVKYLLEAVLTFGIFFTPVFYDAETFGAAGRLLLLNPVAPLLEGLGKCLAGRGAPEPAWILYSAGWALLILLGAYRLFKRLEPSFAEHI